MSDTLHPLAPHHLPFFIAAPGATDVLMNVMIVVLIASVLAIGNLYLRLHALPEHIAHRGHKIQFEIVAVLALLALFTHNHLFWIAGLLLALVQIPDFSTPLQTMAQAQERIARRLTSTMDLLEAPDGGVERPAPVAEPEEMPLPPTRRFASHPDAAAPRARQEERV